MITSPNQRIINVTRDMPKKGSDKPFIYAHIDCLEKASRNLDGEVAYKLYIYLISNKDSYTFAWSPRAFSEAYGVSERSARDAFNQLLSKKYLTSGNRKNEFNFHEFPVASISVATEIKKEFIDRDTDTLYYWTYDELLQNVQDKTTADTLWASAIQI